MVNISLYFNGLKVIKGPNSRKNEWVEGGQVDTDSGAVGTQPSAISSQQDNRPFLLRTQG